MGGIEFASVAVKTARVIGFLGISVPFFDGTIENKVADALGNPVPQAIRTFEQAQSELSLSVRRSAWPWNTEQLPEEVDRILNRPDILSARRVLTEAVSDMPLEQFIINHNRIEGIKQGSRGAAGLFGAALVLATFLWGDEVDRKRRDRT